MTGATSQAVRRLADKLSGAGAASPDVPVRHEPAVVVSVTASGAEDGTDLVTVEWRGTEVDVAYLGSYQPAVEDVVLVAVSGPQLTILGRLAGTPPDTES